MDIHRDKKEEGRDKKEIEKDKREETKEKREEIKHKKENIKENQNTLSEMEMEYEDMKETDKEKEKELMQCTSWAKLRKSGLSLDNIIHLRRRDNVERIIKNRYNIFIIIVIIKREIIYVHIFYMSVCIICI